jgi:hypothetical protein
MSFRAGVSGVTWLLAGKPYLCLNRAGKKPSSIETAENGRRT